MLVIPSIHLYEYKNIGIIDWWCRHTVLHHQFKFAFLYNISKKIDKKIKTKIKNQIILAIREREKCHEIRWGGLNLCLNSKIRIVSQISRS